MTATATPTRRVTSARVAATRGDVMPATPAARPPRDPALLAADTPTAAELGRRSGILTHPFALFGTNGAVASEPPPLWLDDDAEIASRLARKSDQDVFTRAVWLLVADVARGCGMLLRPREPFEPLPRRTVSDLRRTASALARRLPAPRASYLDLGPVAIDAVDLLVWGPPTGAIELAAVNLARAIDDCGWVDPEALAGWVADAITALAHYRAAMPARGAQTRARSQAVTGIDLRAPRPPAPRAPGPVAPAMRASKPADTRAPRRP